MVDQKKPKINLLNNNKSEESLEKRYFPNLIVYFVFAWPYIWSFDCSYTLFVIHLTLWQIVIYILFWGEVNFWNYIPALVNLFFFFFYSVEPKNSYNRLTFSTSECICTSTRLPTYISFTIGHLRSPDQWIKIDDESWTTNISMWPSPCPTN